MYRDSGWIKLMVRISSIVTCSELNGLLQVSILLVADTMNTVFNMWWIYDILINHFSL